MQNGLLQQRPQGDWILFTMRLADFVADNGVVPEFYCDSHYRNLIWSEDHVYGIANIPGLYTNNTMTGYFDGLP